MYIQEIHSINNNLIEYLINYLIPIIQDLTHKTIIVKFHKFLKKKKYRLKKINKQIKKSKA